MKEERREIERGRGGENLEGKEEEKQRWREEGEEEGKKEKSVGERTQPTQPQPVTQTNPTTPRTRTPADPNFYRPQPQSTPSPSYSSPLRPQPSVVAVKQTLTTAIHRRSGSTNAIIKYMKPIITAPATPYSVNSRHTPFVSSPITVNAPIYLPHYLTSHLSIPLPICLRF